MTPSKELKLEFNHERDTKNKRRFQEAGNEDEVAVGTLYVDKEKLEGIGSPDNLEVVIRPKA